MSKHWKISFAFGFISYFMACSPVKFEKLPPPSCQGSGVACVTVCQDSKDRSTCTDKFDTHKKVGDGLVDILIVNDNSASMSFEQSQVAKRFGTFLQSLGNLDYQIAMTTTDISSNLSNTVNNPPRPINGSGRFQDGALLDFDSNLYVLKRNTPDIVPLFNDTIRRQETLDCEAELRTYGSSADPYNCPSGDERGIFAANLVLDRNEHGFLRPTAHLAVIFLADEDVRSGLYRQAKAGELWSSTAETMSENALHTYDQPQTLLSRFQKLYPNKTLSVHSIIVKDDGTGQACLNSQTDQNGLKNVRGSYGIKYADLSRATGGQIGDICAADYGQQLGNIGYTIQDKVNTIPLHCRPLNDQYEITYDPPPVQPVKDTPDFQNMRIQIDGDLLPGTDIRLRYECNALTN